MRESWLRLRGTHLRLSGVTPFADAAPAHEGRRDAVPDGPPPDVGANLDDDADEFVAGHVRQCHPVVVSSPGVPVAAAQARGVHLHHDAAR